MLKTRTVVFASVSLLALVSLDLQKIPRMFGERSYEAGVQHLKAGQYRKAAEAFREANFFMPKEPRPYVDLGDALLHTGQYEEARSSFRKALGLREDSCAFCGLGAAYYRTGRYEEAERAFRRAAELNPDDECAYGWSGSMFYELGRYEEAARAYGRALELKADDAGAVYGLALAHAALGETRSAAAYEERLRALDPAAAAELSKRLGRAAPEQGR